MTPEERKIIKADLPNFPDDILDDWVKTMYGRFGWPPTVQSEWRYVTANRDLTFLQSLKFERQSINIEPRMFDQISLTNVSGVFAANILNVRNLYSFSDGKERMQRCLNYISEHGVFPKSVFIEATDKGFSLLDGNHRMAAFFYLRRFFKHPPPDTKAPLSPEQPCWIAKAM